MPDLIPERLEPTTGISPAERQQSFRDGQQPQRRRPPQPAPPRETEAEVETGSGDTPEDSPHQLDRMA